MAGIVALAAAGVAVARRARRAAGDSPAQGGEPARETWACACGERYLVAGLDRHRIYWPEGAAEGEPLLSDRCPACERPLPADHEAAAALQA